MRRNREWTDFTLEIRKAPGVRSINPMQYKQEHEKSTYTSLKSTPGNNNYYDAEVDPCRQQRFSA